MTAEMRTQSEAVVAATLKTHRIEHWIATASYVCSCKEVTGSPHLTLDQAIGHQAETVMWAPMLGCEHRLGTCADTA